MNMDQLLAELKGFKLRKVPREAMAPKPAATAARGSNELQNVLREFISTFPGQSSLLNQRDTDRFRSQAQTRQSRRDTGRSNPEKCPRMVND